MDLTSNNKDRKRRKPSIDMSTMVYGKVPPQAKEFEEAILGAIMLEPRVYEDVTEIIAAGSFYVEANQKIFEAMGLLYQKHMPIDILTVVEQLKQMELLDAVGGPYYVTKLTNAVVSTANTMAHARIVKQKFVGRELIRIAGEVIGDAYEDSVDVFDLLDDSQQKFSQVAGITPKQLTMADLCFEHSKVLDKRIQVHEAGGIQGISSGFPEMDAITFGWQPTDLITFAAMPSVGKTVLAMNLTANAALDPVKPTPVAFFSREMKPLKLMDRFVAMIAEFDMRLMKSGRITQFDMDTIMCNAYRILEKAPIYMVDASGWNWMDVRREARRLQKKYGVGMIIDDYIQISKDLDPRNKNKEGMLNTIAEENKATAHDLDIPFIQLSQLDAKGVEKKDHKATMNDMSGAAAISAHSDIVAYIYRPEYAGKQADDQGNSTQGKTIIEFLKHREGARESKVELQAKLNIQKFFPRNSQSIIPGKPADTKYQKADIPGVAEEEMPF